MARRYASENFPLPVVAALRELGHDVLTVQEAGKGDQAVPDEEVLAFALAGGRAILTLSRKHFIRLHHTTAAHAGIIACTLDLDFGGQAERIDGAIAGREELTGELVRVNRPTSSRGLRLPPTAFSLHRGGQIEEW